MSSFASSQTLHIEKGRGRTLVVLYWVYTTITAIVIVLRFWARHLKGATGFDDWLMFTCWLLLLAIAIMTTLLASMGGFDHLASIPEQMIPQVLKVLWAAQPFGIIGVAPGKVSVAFTLIRIRGKGGSPTFRIILYAASLLTILVAIFTILLEFFQCNPSAALWEPALIPTAHCLDPTVQADFAIFLGAWNSFVDFVLAIMPATFILKLKIDRKKRLVLSMLLGLSLVTGVTAVIKTTTLRELVARSDITWNLYDLFVWQGAEMFLVILMGSLILLKPLWDTFIAAKPPSRSTTYGGNNSRPSKRLLFRQNTSDLESTLGDSAGHIQVETTIAYKLDDVDQHKTDKDLGGRRDNYSQMV